MPARRAIRGLVTIATGLLILALAAGVSLPRGVGEDPPVTGSRASGSGRPIAVGSDDGDPPIDAAVRPGGNEAPRRAGDRRVGDGAVTADLRPRAAPEPIAPPSVLRIEAVGIEAPVVPTDTDEHGVLEVPPPEQVGWFERWPAPGDRGPAVLAGHVDSRSGPGALFPLVEVRPGMTVEVERQDGSTLTFLVDRVETHPKDRFPTQEVYGEVPGIQLRVITCTGPFDAATRQYRDNLVVFAVHPADE